MLTAVPAGAGMHTSWSKHRSARETRTLSPNDADWPRYEAGASGSSVMSAHPVTSVAARLLSSSVDCTICAPNVQRQYRDVAIQSAYTVTADGQVHGPPCRSLLLLSSSLLDVKRRQSSRVLTRGVQEAAECA